MTGKPSGTCKVAVLADSATFLNVFMPAVALSRVLLPDPGEEGKYGMTGRIIKNNKRTFVEWAVVDVDVVLIRV